MVKDVLQKIGLRFSTAGRFFGYLWRNRLWWLIPIVIVMFIFGAAVILSQSTPLGPFIYTIF